MDNKDEKQYAIRAGTLPLGSERYNYNGHAAASPTIASTPSSLAGQNENCNGDGYAYQTVPPKQSTHLLTARDGYSNGSVHEPPAITAPRQRTHSLDSHFGYYGYTTPPTHTSRQGIHPLASQFEHFTDSAYATPRSGVPPQYIHPFAAQYELNNHGVHATSGTAPPTLPGPNFPFQSFAPTPNNITVADVHNLIAAKLQAGEIQLEQANDEYFRLTAPIFSMSYE